MVCKILIVYDLRGTLVEEVETVDGRFTGERTGSSARPLAGLAEVDTIKFVADVLGRAEAPLVRATEADRRGCDGLVAAIPKCRVTSGLKYAGMRHRRN